MLATRSSGVWMDVGSNNRELIIRFLALGGLPENEFSIGDLGDFLDTKAEELAGNGNYDRDFERLVFTKTFETLSRHGASIFKRYDHAKETHSGRFLISAFEVFAIGLSYHFRQDTAIAIRIPGVTGSV